MVRIWICLCILQQIHQLLQDRDLKSLNIICCANYNFTHTKKTAYTLYYYLIVETLNNSSKKMGYNQLL